MSIQDVTDSACSHSSKSLNFIRRIKFVLSRFVAVTLMLTYMSWLPKATLLPLLRRSGKVLRSILLFTDERRQNHLSSRLHCSCLTKEWWWVYLYKQHYWSRTLLALSRLVGVPLEPVVELLLVPVQAALASAKAVTLLRSCQPLLHVPLIHVHERIFGEKISCWNLQLTISHGTSL